MGRSWLLLLAACGCYATPSTMRAVVTTGMAKEGDFSKVKVVTDRPVPKPGRGQVLIKVAASSVNPVDWKLLSAPIALFGAKVLGFDVSGVIEEVGPGCTRLKVGDAVWADLGEASLRSPPVQLGAWAEYALAEESQVGLKPSTLNFLDAAAIPLAGLTDLQAFRKAGAPWADKPDLSVVVTSGSGGTGVLAIQLARAYNAKQVITAASAANAPLLQSLGATRVVDYHNSTLWDVLPENSVDVVYDNYGAAGTADAAMKALRPGGVFIFLPGKGGAVSKHPKAGVKQINYGLCDSSHHEDLDVLAQFAEAGHLGGVVSQSFPLEGVVAALTASSGGHVVGKVGFNISQILRQESTELHV